MIKGLAVSSIVLSAALAMTGCMANQGDVGNKDIRSNSYKAHGYGMNGARFMDDEANERNRIHGTQQMNNNIAGPHGNSKLEMNQKIADKLAALPEIKSAYVATTNRHAYVAIVEDHAGVNASGKAHAMSHGRGLGAYGVGGAAGTSEAGHAAGSAEVSGFIKSKVADLVKGMDPTVDNVYVSSNPDFYGRMQSYAGEARQGRPIQGLITEFNALVERIFPQSAPGDHRLHTKTAPHYYAPTAAPRSTGSGYTH